MNNIQSTIGVATNSLSLLRYRELFNGLSEYRTTVKVKVDLFNILTKDGFVLEHTYRVSKNPVYKEDTITSGFLVNKNLRILIEFDGSFLYDKKKHFYTMTIFYPTPQYAYIKNLIDKYKKKDKVTNESLVYLLGMENNQFKLISSPLKKTKENIELVYGGDFVGFHNNIVKSLKYKSSGILLLHGIPGTGKTSYIKQLTRIVNKRKFIIIPNYMIRDISNPTLVPFLLQNPDSILIFEDAEEAIKSRDGHGGSAVADILNLSDGLIGSALNCSIIVTFNTGLKNIDSALMRKGRLIGEHEFKTLSAIDSNKLLKALGKNYFTTTPMLLTDIYNYGEEVFKTENKRATIGFARTIPPEIPTRERAIGEFDSYLVGEDKHRQM